MTRRGATLLVATLLLVALIVGGAFLPVPYVAETPGPTFNTIGQVSGKPLITIKGHPTYPATGHLNLTTVEVVPSLSLPAALRYWLDPHATVVPQDLIFPPGQSRQQVKQENAQEMAGSQQHATTAALRALNIPVHRKVVVGAVSKGTPAQKVLDTGDVITAVGSTPVTGADQLRTLIRARKPGQPVTLKIVRDGVTKTVTVDTVAAKGTSTPIVGFVPDEVPSYPFTVDIGLMNVGGPSAGLMFALGIYDLLTPGDLTGGRFIAGTGEIDDAGNVGPIGGIQEKIYQAAQKGARFFLTPAKNCADAMHNLPSSIRLIRVSTLQTALGALKELRDGSGTPTGCSS